MGTNARRVFVHVGVPKSGTTFLQTSLAQHRKALKAAGLLFPAGPPEPMFRAALDVCGNHKAWGRRGKDVSGAWKVLCDKAARFGGDGIISHELLGAASTRQAARALRVLQGLEVHIVVTARDIARQVTAEWQEGIKHGRTTSFHDFAERISAFDPTHEQAQRFWAAQELPGVLSRWGSTVPPERLHLVVCPPPGTPTMVLWQRFAEAVGFDADRFPPADTGANASLGTTQIALLRKVNTALGGRLEQPTYGRVVKQNLSQRLLVRHPSARPELPRPMYAALTHVAQRWVKEIERAGYRIHGDPCDLIPVAPDSDGRHPDDVATGDQLNTAAALIADLLVEASGHPAAPDQTPRRPK